MLRAIFTLSAPGPGPAFYVFSNELGSPKILNCPGNRLKKNATASDWTTGSVGFFNTTVHGEANGKHASATHRTETTKYGRAPGYDNSVSYNLIKTRVAYINFGANPSGDSRAMLSMDFNVNTAETSSATGFPNINPFPGGMQSTYGGNALAANAAEMCNGNMGGTGHTRAWETHDWGFVKGNFTDERFALHGEEGNIAMHDGAVLTPLARADFQAVGVAHYHAIMGPTRQNNGNTQPITWGIHTFTLQPF